MAKTYLTAHSDYKGPFGAAKKEDIYDIGADTLDQQIFEMDNPESWANDAASGLRTHQQMSSRMSRDYGFDFGNPRQELPKGKVDIKNIDEIPNQVMPQPDISTPMDYTGKDLLYLYQDANKNFHAQQNLFTDEKLADKPEYNTDRFGQTEAGKAQREIYSLNGLEGSAAGNVSNRFGVDGERIGSVDFTSAF